MKVYWNMPKGLKPYYQEEVKAYKINFQKGDFIKAWSHLERAHIIGQPWAVKHTHSHWLMLLFAFKIKNTKEIFGQIPRLLIGGVKSYLGKIPVGNTGGANVPPLRSMEIPEDLKKIMSPYISTNNK